MIDTQSILDWLAVSGLRILIIIVGSMVAYRSLGTLTRFLSTRVKAMDEVDGSELDRRTETIFRVVHSTGLVVILTTVVLMVLTELGVPIAPMLASVGVVGLALGLGAQTVVKDVISGLFVLVENQYMVGETIEIGGLVGTVEVMTLRCTLVRDMYGTLHTVPNGEIRTVSNKSRDWSRAIVDVSITYEEDVDAAMKTLQGIGKAMMSDEAIAPSLLEEPEVTGVEGLEDWAIRLRLMVKTLPGQQWNVQRYLRHQIRLVFDREHLGLAVRQQSVTLVSPKS